MSMSRIQEQIQNTPFDTIASIISENVPKLVVINLDEFLALELPERETLLHPWLPKAGLAMIHAAPGIGKTHVALNVAYAVATGGSFLGWKAEKPKVLYVDGEMPAISLQQRLKQILVMCEAVVPPSTLKIITPDLQEGGLPDLATKEGQDIIGQYIAEEIDLVILDNLSCLIQSGKENDAESWQPIQSWILALRRIGKSVLLIHHAGKGGAQRGTSKRADVLDTVIKLDRPKDYQSDQGARFNVTFEKSRGFFGDDAKGLVAHLASDGHKCAWSVSTIEQSTFDKVVSMLNDGMTQSEIATELDLNKSTISRHAANGRSQGLLNEKAQS
jgi:KaiC/GvpD/RAD55 family RecA-like ATPase